MRIAIAEIRQETDTFSPVICTLKNKEAKNAVNRGFRSVMVKVGHNDLDIEVERVAAVRKAVGDKVIIIPDANQGWTPQIAIQFIRKVEPYNVAWVEQPVPRWDIDGLARVRESVNTPISADGKPLFDL